MYSVQVIITYVNISKYELRLLSNINCQFTIDMEQFCNKNYTNKRLLVKIFSLKTNISLYYTSCLVIFKADFTGIETIFTAKEINGRKMKLYRITCK